MQHSLYISRGLEKKLSVIRRSGKRGELAVLQCDQLLSLVQSEGVQVREVYNKRTKNGECRIGNCIKYDLGGGYRLVTIKNGQDLFVPFVGGHDETDLWLQRHKFDTFRVDDPAFVPYCQTEKVSGSELEASNEQEYGSSADIYEEQLQARLDDTLLKTIFSGLFSQKQGR